MQKTVLVIMTALLWSLQAQAQTARNIRLRLDATIRKMVIEYDLQDIQRNDSLYVLIETASGQIITPRTITGAVGKGLHSGVNQVAYWDILQDSARINGLVQARVQFVRPALPEVAEKPKPKSANPVLVQEQPKEVVKTEVKKAPTERMVFQRLSQIPVIGYIATGGLGLYSIVLASAIGKDSQAYNSKEFVTTPAEKAQYDDMLSSLKSRKSTFTLVVGSALAVGIATTIYTLVRKPAASRVSLTSPPGSFSTNIGLAYSF